LYYIKKVILTSKVQI